MSSPVIRIGLIGNVDAGKSSLLGVLTKLKDGEYDDGRGYARSQIMRFGHELDTGRTSSITKEHTTINDKIIEFVDLAGHEKYLKTTMSGLCGNCIDYVLLIVGGNMGVVGTTKEHLSIALGLKIPVIVIVTKIDVAPKNKLNETNQNMKQLIKKTTGGGFAIMVNDDVSMNQCIEHLSERKYTRITPLFNISNKVGTNIPLLKRFLGELPNKYKFKPEPNVDKFWIHHVYVVTGIGTVLYGITTSGEIHKNDKLQMGPFEGKFKTIVVKSIHDDDRNEISTLAMGKTGCLAIRSITKKDSIQRKNIRNGMIVCNKPHCSDTFEALIVICHHSTTIRKGYQCVIHCGTIRQTARFVKVENLKDKDNLNLLRTGNYGKVTIKFIQRPEYIENNMRFMIREGKTVAVGQIKKVII